MAKSRSARQSSLPGMESEPVRSNSPAPAQNNPPVAAVDRKSQRSPDGPTLPPDLTGKTVYAIDANSLIFQVFHAIPEMTSPRGEPVNAVFGFTRDLLFLLEKKPDYIFCAFDMAGPTFRDALFEAYKGTRSEMPHDLRPQFPLIRQMIEALGIPIVELEGFEADDVLATIAHLSDNAGGQCLVVTGDKDCRQLITDRVAVYNVRKDQVYDAAALAADWGIRPDQVVDYQSMVGDSVDNVPGIPLIGPKIARELLEKYGTLDEIFAHAGEIAGTKRRENIINGREQALLSKQLVRLDTNVPIVLPWEAARTGQHDGAAALGLCTKFGFHRFAEQLRAAQTHDQPPTWECDYQAIDSAEQFAAWLPRLAEQRQFALHVVPSSNQAERGEIAGLAVAWTPGVAWYLPLEDNAGPAKLARAATLAALRPVLEDPQKLKISRDLKQDALLLLGAGIQLQGFAIDTMLASYLLDAGERNHTLAELAQRYLTHKLGSASSANRPESEGDATPNSAAVADLCQAAEEVDVALRLAPLLTQSLRDEQLEWLLVDLELPLASVLAEMERTGIRIDPLRLAELSAQYGERVNTLETEIYALAGHEFNIASPKQLQQVLFTEQKLPALRRNKSGPSTDASVLEELAEQHPLPAKIIAFRQYSKLKNTYVDALPALVCSATGRVHATFQQAVAATGRLSSSDPNLQNIPIRSREGREIRSAFLPDPPGWKLLSADYSQIELRVLAHFSRDETLLAAFARGDDIHAQVASQVFGVLGDEVTSEMRRRAKAVNFGVLYGQSAFGLAKGLNIEQDEAAQFITAYFDRYPGVNRFLTEILEGCRINGYVKTVLGRKRAIRGVRSDAPRQRNLPERTAINTVIQGSAADLIKLAMLAVRKELRAQKLQARLLLQIHDELLFEAPEEELESLADLVRDAMAGVMPLAVPLVVDVKSGANWAETEPWSHAAGTDVAGFPTVGEM